VEAALEHADGDVTVELFRGQARAVARTSPKTLHRPDLASFDMTGYDAGHAEGFIRLFGLPLATAARRGSSPSRPPSVRAQRSKRRPERSLMSADESRHDVWRGRIAGELHPTARALNDSLRSTGACGPRSWRSPAPTQHRSSSAV